MVKKAQKAQHLIALPSFSKADTGLLVVVKDSGKQATGIPANGLTHVGRFCVNKRWLSFVQVETNKTEEKTFFFT